MEKTSLKDFYEKERERERLKEGETRMGNRMKKQKLTKKTKRNKTFQEFAN